MAKVSKSGFKGVVQRGKTSFEATLSIRARQQTYTKNLGSYPTAKEAYKARCEYIDSLK